MGFVASIRIEATPRPRGRWRSSIRPRSRRRPHRRAGAAEARPGTVDRTLKFTVPEGWTRIDVASAVWLRAPAGADGATTYIMLTPAEQAGRRLRRLAGAQAHPRRRACASSAAAPRRGSGRQRPGAHQAQPHPRGPRQGAPRAGGASPRARARARCWWRSTPRSRRRALRAPGRVPRFFPPWSHQPGAHRRGRGAAPGPPRAPAPGLSQPRRCLAAGRSPATTTTGAPTRAPGARARRTTA